MGSLFVIVCPTREHEIRLRQRELENELQRQSFTSTASIPSATRKPDAHFNSISLPSHASLGALGLVTSDEDTISRIKHRSNSKLTEEDIQNIIDTIHLEKHLEETMKKFSIWHAVWAPTVDERLFQVTFTVPQSKSEKIIHHLQTCGFGVKYESSICVSAGNVYIADLSCMHANTCSLPKVDQGGDISSDDDDNDDQIKKKKGHWNDFVASIKSRLTVAQVVQSVTNNAIITFDYITLIFVAAVIAALGLLENNSVALVASMLISPLMGPIMAFVFSFVIHDKNLTKLGAYGAGIGLLQCLIVGLITGISIEAKPFRGPWADVTEWPTGEMVGRSQMRSLIVGALIAIPSGVGVALSILAGNSGSLVGVAISASLLPPAVNCGVFWGMTIVVTAKEFYDKDETVNLECDKYLGHSKTAFFSPNYKHTYCRNAAKEFALLGGCSLLLTIINIILIFIFGIIILRIKEFAPYTTRKNLHRFWKEDLKAVREYNAAHGGVMREEDILKDINAVENPDELKQNLANDAVLNTINKKTGRTIQDLSIYAKKEDHVTVQIVPPPVEQPQATGGWFSWFKKQPEGPVNSAPIEVVEERARKVIIRRPTVVR